MWGFHRRITGSKPRNDRIFFNFCRDSAAIFYLLAAKNLQLFADNHLKNTKASWDAEVRIAYLNTCIHLHTQ